MKEIFRTICLLLALSIPAAADQAPSAPKDPSPAAVAFVEGFSDNHLTAMLTRIGARHPTLVGMSALHGQMLAAVYDAEVAKAVEKYGPEWQQNMARSWTGLMTDSEFNSLMTEGAKSPYSEKYKSVSPEAGQRMQTISQDLFRTILAEAIQNTIESLAEPATDPDSAGSDKPEKEAD